MKHFAFLSRRPARWLFLSLVLLGLTVPSGAGAVPVEPGFSPQSPLPAILTTGAGISPASIWSYTPPVAPRANAPVMTAGFQRFVNRVTDGQAGVLRGVHVEGVLGLQVVQQPEGDRLYVDVKRGTATQFQSAAKKGVTGLLAHNYLSGELFFNLEMGQEVHLVYGDGRIMRYRINEIQRYQKLEPENVYSNYRDLQTDEILTTSQVFNRVYTGSDHVTLQTCIEKDGDWSWGLIFLIAEPV